jgi:RNA polymerase sigma factor (sigma-70 family)
MASTRMIEQLRGSAESQTDADRTDGQLLEDFIRRRSQAAVAALVYRHGPMVWGVCRRVLSSHHEAEDAFQATFLVLARKAESVVPREMVANWLYGVARQTARKARALVARRGARERQVTPMPELPTRDADLWHDLLPVLDEEVSRLPSKYRGVLVLCDLEGRTRGEAARTLHWPEGTVAGRLARARELLAKRLTRRGVALTGAALACLLWQNTASAQMPATVAIETIRVVGHRASGQTEFASAKLAAPVTTSLLSGKRLKVKVALMTSLVVVGLATVAYVMAPRRADTAQLRSAREQASDLRLIGSWHVVAADSGGKHLSSEAARDYGPWSFEAGQFRNLGTVLTSSGSYSIDTKPLQKRITFSPAAQQGAFAAESPVAGEGTYEFKGDTLLLRLPIPRQGAFQETTDRTSRNGPRESALLTLKRNSQALPVCHDAK